MEYETQKANLFLVQLIDNLIMFYVGDNVWNLNSFQIQFLKLKIQNSKFKKKFLADKFDHQLFSWKKCWCLKNLIINIWLYVYNNCMFISNFCNKTINIWIKLYSHFNYGMFNRFWGINFSNSDNLRVLSELVFSMCF